MAATVRILVVEDDPNDAALAEREVRRADILCTFLRVDTRDGMAEAREEFLHHAVRPDPRKAQLSVFRGRTRARSSPAPAREGAHRVRPPDRAAPARDGGDPTRARAPRRRGANGGAIDRLDRRAP